MPGAQLGVGTFSIVAIDPRTGDLGVAVQSKYLAVGAVVPWLAAGVGALATQAQVNTDYGPLGLELLRRGLSASEVVSRLVSGDDRAAARQLGVVDAHGGVANFTGEECPPWAGAAVGATHTAQGNTLAGPKVAAAMVSAFEASSRDLSERLLLALQSAQDAGGDTRGQQSAAVVVVSSRVGHSGYNDRIVDLRVDDHPTPIAELRRLLELHRTAYPLGS